ncbi:putative GTP-binding protein ypt1 [Blattamonas nauphoetae]|uniref:GTP-binding protein ypt1 n=1 Tax=Blattamonas nauphoetae TaxID=2049346 RepID=A0ABQ9WZ29_9EUKA|nr:putative GTP-binding protein ypt1 [Blattamonas nauphoetae]
MEYDRVAKILILGDYDSKGRNLQAHFAHSRYYVSGIGIDFVIRTVQTDEEKVKFQIWDASSYSRFGTISPSYFRGTSVLLVAYNPMIETTFRNIQRWLEEADIHLSPSILRMLVEHTSSHDRPREVPIGAGKEMAESLGLLYGEVDSTFEQYNDDILELLADELHFAFPLDDVQPSSRPPQPPLKTYSSDIRINHPIVLSLLFLFFVVVFFFC